MAAYATTAELFERKRIDTIRDLAADDGVRPSRSDTLTNGAVLAAINDASGAIETALVTGQRYTPTQLEGLTGNSRYLLVRVCCDIAMAFLYERNPMVNADEATKHRELATQYLDRLSNGENLFNLSAALDASVPTIGGPTLTEYSTMNLLVDRCSPGYFPSRGSRNPTNRG